MSKRIVVLSLILFYSFFIYPGEKNTIADQGSAYHSARFTLYFGKEASRSHTLLTEKEIADFAIGVLDSTYNEYSALFKQKLQKKVTLRFLSPAEFKRYTGAPSWTSAMFFNDEITIPLNPKKGINLTELGRALRHEYAHAVISEISDGKCPAWLDEGIAQYLEGKTNPLLGPALRDWISKNDAMPLHWLQNGFTLLDDDLVPAAYAQSLYSTKKIIRDVGMESIGLYLKDLRNGIDEEHSFENAFHINEKSFTEDLTKDIRIWARSGAYNP